MPLDQPASASHGDRSGLHVGPVIAVTDLARARRFYEDLLGLQGAATPGGWALHADQGTVIYLLADVAGAGTTSWPVASFRVSDVHQTVRSLRKRGVRFLDHTELPFDLDDDGVSVTDDMQVAWLRDPDGSVLTIFSLIQDDSWGLPRRPGRAGSGRSADR